MVKRTFPKNFYGPRKRAFLPATKKMVHPADWSKDCGRLAADWSKALEKARRLTVWDYIYSTRTTVHSQKSATWLRCEKHRWGSWFDSKVTVRIVHWSTWGRTRNAVTGSPQSGQSVVTHQRRKKNVFPDSLSGPRGRLRCRTAGTLQSGIMVPSRHISLVYTSTFGYHVTGLEQYFCSSY